MNKKQTKKFLQEYFAQLSPARELQDRAFETMFSILDENGDESISQGEMAAYITVLFKVT